MNRAFAIAVSALVLAACTHATNTRVTYTSFGEADPAKDADVIARYEVASSDDTHTVAYQQYLREHPEAKQQLKQQAQLIAAVRVLVDTLPEGISLKDGNLAVAQPERYQLLGKFHVVDGSRIGTAGGALQMKTFTRAELLDDAKRLAVQAGGNLVLMGYEEASEQDKAYGVQGYILKAAPGTTDAGQGTPAKLPTQI